MNRKPTSPGRADHRRFFQMLSSDREHGSLIVDADLDSIPIMAACHLNTSEAEVMGRIKKMINNYIVREGL